MSFPRVLLALLAVTACASPSPESQPRNADSGFVAVPGARLFYKSVGRGDPMLVVHGGPGLEHAYLLPGMLGLAKSNRLVFYDQRGGGRSEGEVNSATVSFDRFIADIDAVADSLRLGSFVLLGHSWGGLLALQFADRYPNRLRALVLMNTEEPGQRYLARTIEIATRRAAPDSAARARLVASEALRRRDTSAMNAILRLAFRSTFADTALAHRLEVHLAPRTAQNLSRVAELVMGPLAKFDMWDVAARVRVPTLVLQGADDVTPIEMARELARTIPSAQLSVIDNAGHFPYVEKPTETIGAINGFLSRVKPLPASRPDGKVPFTVRPRP
jgi:proline iminopeptidase